MLNTFFLALSGSFWIDLSINSRYFLANNLADAFNDLLL